MKTLITKIAIDTIMSLAVIGSIMSDALTQATTLIIVATVVSFVNIIFEYVIIPLIRHYAEKLKKKTPPHIDKIIDDIVDNIENRLEDKKEDIIDEVKKYED